MPLDFIHQTIERNKLEKIYVMIPSLFDDSILDTVMDCINKAEYPERITFGISIQGLENIDFSAIKNEKRIIKLDKNIVYGIGKTRYQLQKLYNDEEYILSIDCHTGFKQGWDTWLIDKFLEINDDKAIITQYLYEDFTNLYQKSMYKFSPSDPWMIIYDTNPIKTDTVDGYYKVQRFSPHFVFSNKNFMEVDYSTKILWGQEEHLMSIKYFCNGFNMYELQETVLTTIPKDKQSCEERDNWLYYAYNMYALNKKIVQSSTSVFGKSIEIDYDYSGLDLSYHLINKNTGLVDELRPAVADLLENDFSDILKEDFRKSIRKMKEYYDFHNINKAQIDQTIRINRKGHI